MLLDFYELQRKKIADRKETLSNEILSGSLPSYEDYRALCGKFQENVMFEEMIKSILHKLQNYDN